MVRDDDADGVILAQGGDTGGWAFTANGGKLKYCYNLGGVQHFYVEATSKLPAGEHQVRMEFAYAGGGLGKGGKVSLYVDGKQVGAGDIPGDVGDLLADDGCDVGEDGGAPVSPDYGPRGNAFNGRERGANRHRRCRREFRSPCFAGGSRPHCHGAAVRPRAAGPQKGDDPPAAVEGPPATAARPHRASLVGLASLRAPRRFQAGF